MTLWIIGSFEAVSSGVSAIFVLCAGFTNPARNRGRLCVARDTYISDDRRLVGALFFFEWLYGHNKALVIFKRGAAQRTASGPNSAYNLAVFRVENA